MNESDNNHSMVKVYFEIDQDEDGYPPVDVESIWASQEKEGVFRIANIPFFSDEATLDDLVSCVEDDGTLWFDEVIRESGNSLVWVILFEGRGTDVAEDLERIGCDVERYNEQQLAISIPEDVSLAKVQGYLSKYEDNDELEYAEPILRQ